MTSKQITITGMRMMFRRTLLLSVLLSGIVLCSRAGTAFAQDGFLKKLEEAVKNQLSDTDADASSEELPAPVPKPNTGAKSNPVPPRPVPVESTMPLVPPPTSAPSQNLGDQPAVVEDSGAKGQSYLGLEVEETLGGQIGVRITSLADQSPAWKAGFKIGDRIQAINGYAIAKLDDMVTQLAKSVPGESVRFLVRRGDRTLQLTAVLMDAGLASATGRPVPNSDNTVTGEAILGVTVNDLSNSFRRQFGITVFRGAAVSTVSKGSPAEKAGIRAGEAIVEANGIPIDGAVSMGRFIASTRPGQKVFLTVYRGGFSRTVEVVMGLAPGTSRSMTRPSISSNFTAPVSPSRQLESIPQSDARPQVLELSRNGGSILEPDSAQSARASSSVEVEQLRTQNAQLAEQLRLVQEELRTSQQQLRETQEKLNRILDLVNGKNR